MCVSTKITWVMVQGWCRDVRLYGYAVHAQMCMCIRSIEFVWKIYAVCIPRTWTVECCVRSCMGETLCSM